MSKVIVLASIYDRNDRVVAYVYLGVKEANGQFVITLVFDEQHGSYWKKRLSSITAGTIILRPDSRLEVLSSGAKTSVLLSKSIAQLSAGELCLISEVQGIEKAQELLAKLRLRRSGKRVSFKDLIDFLNH